ncbi:MAG TPA: dNTP triphosphohydrolase [Terracidiphilus sp.]|nr:dNTP triphosphohydrolase [Terracidiphilus sp.]
MMSRPPESAYQLPAAIAVPDSGELAQRAHAEPPHAYRTPFARDGARVLHARAFRRLAGKTQVFTRLPGERAGDHFRSRLTHTLEVSQIARTLAAALGLNGSLTEALALVHDIGHPPFGHAGEKALDRSLRAYGLTFDHNLHALRIVTWFEERYAAFRGLNLTLGVREGIIKHSRDYAPAQFPELDEYFLDLRPPLEAQLIDLADEIAYLTADLDDGLDSGILEFDQVRQAVPLFRRSHEVVHAQFPAASPRLIASEALRRMLNALVTDLMREVHARVTNMGIATLRDVREARQRVIALSAEMEAERAIAKKFLYDCLYNSPGMEEAHRHAEQVVERLFERFMLEPELLPDDHRSLVETEGLARTVTDYIAGMTDGFIEQQSRDLGT